MKKTILVALGLLAVGVASSKADVAFSVSFGNYHYTPRHYTPRYHAPVYAAPACPTPVVVAPVCSTPVAPVVVTPAPVYRHYQPVYRPVYRPQPVVVAQPVYGHGYGYAAPHCDTSPGWGRSRNSVSIRW